MKKLKKCAANSADVGSDVGGTNVRGVGAVLKAAQSSRKHHLPEHALTRDRCRQLALLYREDVTESMKRGRYALALTLSRETAKHCLLSFDHLSENLRENEKFVNDSLGKMWDVIVAGNAGRANQGVADSLCVIQNESERGRYSTHEEVGLARCERVWEHVQRICTHFGVVEEEPGLC